MPFFLFSLSLFLFLQIDRQIGLLSDVDFTIYSRQQIIIRKNSQKSLRLQWYVTALVRGQSASMNMKYKHFKLLSEDLYEQTLGLVQFSLEMSPGVFCLFVFPEVLSLLSSQNIGNLENLLRSRHILVKVSRLKARDSQHSKSFGLRVVHLLIFQEVSFSVSLGNIGLVPLCCGLN